MANQPSTFRPGVYGSAVTTMNWHFGSSVSTSDTGVLIAFCQNATVSAPTPVAAPVAIQPMNAIRPVEIITAGAQGMGSITLTLTMLYNQEIWQRLAGLASSVDITDILRTLAQNSSSSLSPLSISRIFDPLLPQAPAYHEIYQGCVVASVSDDAQIDVTTMNINKTMTLNYAKIIRSGFTGMGTTSLF